MDPTTQYNAATNIAKDTQPATADLFFDAAQVDTTPLETGSEDLFQVATANNPGGGGGGGLPFRQLGGAISVASSTGNPTTDEFITALESVYTTASLIPAKSDLVSLRINGGTRLVARFLIMDDDSAATNATISFTVSGTAYVGLNLNFSSPESLVDGIEDFAAGPNGGQNPDGRDVLPGILTTIPFAISVEDIYDTNAGGFLIPPTGNTAEISVNAGTYTFSNGITSSQATGVAQDESFTTGDGVAFYDIVLTVTATLSGTQKTVQSATAALSINARASGSSIVTGTTTYNLARTQAVKTFVVGTVELARRGNRRFARITQNLVGNLDSSSGNDTGSGPSGVDTKAGFRQVTIVIDGVAYNTMILTSSLIQVT